MNRISLLSVSIFMLILGVSTSVAGGKYLSRPDSMPITIKPEKNTIPKSAEQKRFKGKQRIASRLQRFKRSESIRGTFVRMKRSHFIR